MLNQIVLVGRLTGELQVKELEGDKKVAYITLAVNRAYKNEEGIYETDFIPCTLWNGLAENTAEYCKIGDLVGVKGRLESGNNGIELIAEKVTFLSSSKVEDKED